MPSDSPNARRPAIIPDEAVSGLYRLDRKPESTSERVKRLQDEAKMLAREEIDSLVRELQALAARARAIAEGGEVYPVGVRELAERLAEDLPLKAESATAIVERLAGERR